MRRSRAINSRLPATSGFLTYREKVSWESIACNVHVVTPLLKMWGGYSKESVTGSVEKSSLRSLSALASNNGNTGTSSFEKGVSTKVAISPFRGRPIPMRSLRKLSLPRWVLMERRPLWPCSPPPFCILTVPKGSSRSSCTTRTSSALIWKKSQQARTDIPLSFI